MSDKIEGLVGSLRQAATNIENARNSGIAEHLAGWEHRVIREALSALRTQRDEVIEECAAVAVDYADHYLGGESGLGAAIRNLKSQDEPVKSGKID